MKPWWDARKRLNENGFNDGTEKLRAFLMNIESFTRCGWRAEIGIPTNTVSVGWQVVTEISWKIWKQENFVLEETEEDRKERKYEKDICKWCWWMIISRKKN